MVERRKAYRTPFDKIICFSLHAIVFKEVEKFEVKAKTTDISDKGLGFMTDFPVEPGHVLYFHNCMMPKFAIIRWSEKSGSRYNAGAEFV